MNSSSASPTHAPFLISASATCKRWLHLILRSLGTCSPSSSQTASPIAVLLTSTALPLSPHPLIHEPPAQSNPLSPPFVGFLARLRTAVLATCSSAWTKEFPLLGRMSTWPFITPCQSGTSVDIPRPKECNPDCIVIGTAMDVNVDVAAGSSFRALLVWSDNNYFISLGIFSSDTRCWHVFPSVHLGVHTVREYVRVGDILYWILDDWNSQVWNKEEANSLLALDMRTSLFFHVELPIPHMSRLYEYNKVKILGSEEHGLRLVAIPSHLLQVWLRKDDGDGWVLEKEVDLQASFHRIVGEELTFEQFITGHHRI